MSALEIRVLPRARHRLEILLGSEDPQEVWQGERLRIAVDALVVDPRPSDAQLLEEASHPVAYQIWRLTVHWYRILYKISRETLTVLHFTTGLV